MDTKELIKYGVLIIVGWLALQWFLGVVQGVASEVGSDFSPARQPYYGPGMNQGSFLYWNGYGGSPVRWSGPPSGVWGAHPPRDGRQPGTGGY
jgi:hypothetical protein